MLVFKTIELSDKEVIKNHLSTHKTNLFTYSFEVLWLWRNVFEFQYTICEKNDALFIKTFTNNTHYFLFPLGNKNEKECIELILHSAKSIGCEPIIGQVSPENRIFLETTFPNQFEITANRDEFEYLYLSNRLIGLGGKKLQHKRNNINFLEKNYTWNFELMCDENWEECLRFSKNWDVNLHEEFSENKAFYEALYNYKTLELDCGILRINGNVEAISMGCPLNDKVYLTLFEKANPEIRGIYSLINKEFSSRFCQKYQWINRAEDGGMEGLRQAKLSYYPDILQEIYMAKMILP